MQEILEKWQRVGQGMSMMNREAHYQALTAVKPTIISYITKMVSGMLVDGLQTFMILGNLVTLRKLQPDSYSGTIKAPNGDIIHVFDLHSIPQIAGQIQSLFELYDDVPEEKTSEEYEKLVGKLKEANAPEVGDDPGLVSQLLGILMPTPDEKETQHEIQEVLFEAQDLTEEIKDKRKEKAPIDEIQKLKDEVKAMLTRVEALVASKTPVKPKEDKTLQAIDDFRTKHDDLVDRAQFELNLLTDKIEEVKHQIHEFKESVSEGKVVHVHINT